MTTCKRAWIAWVVAISKSEHCAVVMLSLFSKILTIDTPELAHEVEVWVVFYSKSGPLFTEQYDVLPPNHLKSQSHEIDVIKIISLSNLTCILAALLPTCLSKFSAIGEVKTWISWLWVYDVLPLSEKRPWFMLQLGHCIAVFNIVLYLTKLQWVLTVQQ